MTRDSKIELVNALTKEFEDSNALIVCNYKGLQVKNLEALRCASKDKDIKVQVIKNKLASIALKQAGYTDAGLKDTNIFIWSNDQIELSKVVCKFQEGNDKFEVKFGYFDKEVVDNTHITTMSKLPNKQELIGMLLSVWSGPARYFVSGLDNLRKQKEESN